MGYRICACDRTTTLYGNLRLSSSGATLSVNNVRIASTFLFNGATNNLILRGASTIFGPSINQITPNSTVVGSGGSLAFLGQITLPNLLVCNDQINVATSSYDISVCRGSAGGGVLC